MSIFEADNSLDPMIEELYKNKGLYNSIGLPEYDQYAPELFKNESANYSLTSEDPAVRSRQLEAISKLSDLSNEGLSEADQAGFARARDVGTKLARQGTQAALENAASRGISGSGLELAMRESANQDAAERARQNAMDMAQAKAAQRGQYLQAYAGQLGGMRDQDYRANAGNTDVINRFNQMNTQNRNQTQNANVGLRNEAWQYNQGLKDKNYQNQLGRADRIAGMNTKQGELQSAQSEAEKKRRAGLVGAVGAGIGGAFGGPAGAQVGYGVGSAVG